jgi:dihydrolipoamide dehydrogenase
MSLIDLVVPDIGNAHDVDVVDVLVKPGDVVEVDAPLVTLETDKASMDVPSTSAGKVAEVLLKRGDKASAGTVIARLDTNAAAADNGAPAGASGDSAAPPSADNAGAAPEETFAASFDADELERTVTQPILKQGAPPPAGNGNGATYSAVAPAPAARPAGPPGASTLGPGQPTSPFGAASDPAPGGGQPAPAFGAAPGASRSAPAPATAPGSGQSASASGAPSGAGQTASAFGPASGSGQPASAFGAASGFSPPASGNAASSSAGAAGTAAAPIAFAPGPSSTSSPPLGARQESAGDTVRMPIPDLSRIRGESDFSRSTQLLVLGSGPGGYTAAFRAADLGLQVTLVERWSDLGGVCLNVGCIPSKALLHAAKVIEDAEAMSEHGIAFGAPALDLDRLREWKGSVVKKLTGGLRVLAKQRKVDVVQGTGRFVSPNVLEVMSNSGSERIRFDQCIIAVGSEPIRLPGMPADPRIMDSTDALTLPEFSGGLLVIGGGIIGLEMACVYDALGSRVSVVELTPQLIPGCDPDLVRPLERRIRGRYEQILLGTKVTKVEALSEGLRVTFEGEKAPPPSIFERVLVAVGRVPNGKTIAADVAGVKVTDRGFIPVDKQMRTNVPHIFAIGDVASMPMLAHKAMHEAKVAAEVAAGEKAAFDARVIPSVAYTDPEVAWVGLTETEAKDRNIAYKKGTFPWVANGRSLSLGRDEGLTKLLFDPETHRVLGGGVVGTNAGELITEIALAIETGCDAADVGLTVHPHPTLSETVAAAADAFEGTLTDLYIPRK